MAAADSGETPAPAQYKGKYCGNWMSRAKDYRTPGSLVVGVFFLFCFVFHFRGFWFLVFSVWPRLHRTLLGQFLILLGSQEAPATPD